MAVDDDEAVVGIVQEERFADPAEVRLLLLVKLDSGPDPGMDEKELAETAAVDEALEKLDMFPRHGIPHNRQGIIFAQAAKRFRVDTVALEAFGTTEPTPFGDQLRLTLDDAQQDFLVIAEQEYRPDSRTAIGPEAFYHLRGLRPAIDQIADEDEQRLRCRAVLQLGMYLGQQIFKKVEPAVHVANDISPVPPGPGGDVLTSRGKAEHQATDLKAISGRQERRDRPELQNPR